MRGQVETEVGRLEDGAPLTKAQPKKRRRWREIVVFMDEREAWGEILRF